MDIFSCRCHINISATVEPIGDSNVTISGKSSLIGKLLISMPNIEDNRFDRTVIYVCAHNEEGAMGIVLNKPMPLDFEDLMQQLDIHPILEKANLDILAGGPVETSRGFVLHSTDFLSDSSVEIDENIALTSTVDILRAIAYGKGPAERLMALGYAGWGPGQLDAEMQANGWLHLSASRDIVFSKEKGEATWVNAIAKLGIDPSTLSPIAGHA